LAVNSSFQVTAMNKRVRIIAAIGFAFFLEGAGSLQAANVSEFADFSLRSGTTTLLPGRLYIPPAAVTDPATPRPFILFMHGAGESGVNNSAQVNGNIDNLLAEAKRRSAFLYAPQTNGGWNSATILDRVKTMIDQAVGQQPIDAARLYVTGLSMGGGGTWNMLNRYADFFAAAVPICGVSPATGFAASNLLDDSIWAFHARDDSVVSFQTTRNVVNEILTVAGADLPVYPDRRSTSDFIYTTPAVDLNYVELGHGGHGIWPRVYSTPPLYDWLFAHTLAVPEPHTAGMLAVVAAMLTSRRRCRTRRSPHWVAA
jgi:predicted peptidase